jgi:hypothetical protein
LEDDSEDKDDVEDGTDDVIESFCEEEEESLRDLVRGLLDEDRFSVAVEPCAVTAVCDWPDAILRLT